MTDLVAQPPEHQPLRAHIERHLGPIADTFVEPASVEPASGAPAETRQIAIQWVKASAERPIHTLITTGMSDRPMRTGPESTAPRLIELMMTLPRTWQFEDPRTDGTGYWPVRLLAQLARHPEEHATWLGWGHTVPNGEPPAPYAPGTALCGIILAPSLLVPKEFYALQAGSRNIEFYAAIPLYQEELQLAAREGMQHLLSSLIDHGLNDIVEPRRRNITKKRFFGLF